MHNMFVVLGRLKKTPFTARRIQILGAHDIIERAPILKAARLCEKIGMKKANVISLCCVDAENINAAC